MANWTHADVIDRLLLWLLYLLAVGLVLFVAVGSAGAAAPVLPPALPPPPPAPLLEARQPYTPTLAYLPVIFKPTGYVQPGQLKDLASQQTITLPQPLSGAGMSWCTWGWCTVGPRLYHEPLSDGRTLIGWTDASGNGHVSRVGAAGLETTFDFPGTSLRGLIAHDNGPFAVLLWDANAKIMWLTKRNADGSQVWKTSVDGSLTSFNPEIGDSRLAYGGGRYGAYFAVHGDSGWVQGHEGDQLIYVDDAGSLASGGWEWGCSHSMAELISYHPSAGKFLPVCASDCYAQKGILTNDSQVVYAGDGNCGGQTSAQLGQSALAVDSWKLVFSALDRPGFASQGIGLATIDAAFASHYVWLTNTTGENERDPVLARLGSSLSSDRFLVGWLTTNDGIFHLGVINAAGSYLSGPQAMPSGGPAWGNRDDSFRTRPDGKVSWVQAEAGANVIHLWIFDGTSFLSR